jgi:hypothetical protein
MTITPGLVVGAALLVATVVLVASGGRLGARWPRHEWLVSIGRLLLGVSGIFFLATATVLAKPDITCGIVVAINQSSLTDVHGFTLRTADGSTFEYRLEAGRLAADSFVPGHLREHLALSAPVCVTHAAGDLLALDLKDQLIPSPSP